MSLGAVPILAARVTGPAEYPARDVYGFQGLPGGRQRSSRPLLPVPERTSADSLSSQRLSGFRRRDSKRLNLTDTRQRWTAGTRSRVPKMLTTAPGWLRSSRPLPSVPGCSRRRTRTSYLTFAKLSAGLA